VVSYDTGIEPLADGAGWSLVPRTEAVAPVDPTPDGWRLSAFPGGSPAAPDLASLPAPTDDGDGDGLPDAWEKTHGLDPASAAGDDGAAGDPDGDGMSNLAEFMAGTDPRSAASRVVFAAKASATGRVVLRFGRIPGRACRVVALDALGGNPVETEDFPAQAIAGEEEIVVDPGTAARFFRLEFR
jgi:hypothetical protein